MQVPAGGLCKGRVVIVTGASQGLGRSHAIAFARQGATVVVNDVSPSASAVVDEIVASGGQASLSVGSVCDWDYAQALISETVERHGALDTLVNNAGINRDRMLVNMSEQEWDTVIDVDLKGHFAPLRHAAAWWRDQAKAGNTPVARVINTSSGAGLMGSVGQINYAAAKAGIAVITQIAGAELARYGVTVNAIEPSARTPMTATVFAEEMAVPDVGFDAMDPANVSPLVVWLGSAESGHVTGRMFHVTGGDISVTDGWRHGVPVSKDDRWDPSELGPVVSKLIASAPVPEAIYGA
jgi:NAD(P)-dependent dehydrogenase (short-subunit alcohol dehydrogenase family)